MGLSSKLRFGRFFALKAARITIARSEIGERSHCRDLALYSKDLRCERLFFEIGVKAESRASEGATNAPQQPDKL